MTAILLIGLLALASAYAALARRILLLEREVRQLKEGSAGAESRLSVEPNPWQPNPAGEMPRASEPAAPTAFAVNLFESLVGGRLLIWIGGAALVIAAIFLIRYSIEIGLVTPALRMIVAGMFGLALVGAGEWARASPRFDDDPRVAQALVGAGLGILYATVYGSHILYGFFGLGTASVLMLGVTAGALALSLRSGQATALMGLVGGFLTPALVGDANAGALPLLLYLALLDAAVIGLAWRRRWTWLGALAVLATFGWTATLLFGPVGDATAAGLFILILAVLAAFAWPAGALMIAHPVAIAAAEIAVLIMRSDLGEVPWLLFGCLSIASLFAARLRHQAPWLPLLILLMGLGLLPLKWLVDDAAPLAAAAAGLALLFGGGGFALALERRSAGWSALACIGIAAPVIILRWLTPSLMSGLAWGMLQAGLAFLPLILVRASRIRGDTDRTSARALLPALCVTLLLTSALFDLVPEDILSIAWLALAIAIVTAGIRLPERTLRVAGLGLLTLTILKVFLIDAAALEGVLRILSFLGLGAALIVLGKYYGTLLRAERSSASAG